MAPRRHDDSSVWIGYADFLTTLTILFFVLAVSFAGKISQLSAGVLEGHIIDVSESEATADIQGCLVTLGHTRQQRTDKTGAFSFVVDSLRDRLSVGLGVHCLGYSDYSEIVTLAPGDTTRLDIRLTKARVIEVDTLSGDALFASNSYQLREGALDTIRVLGLRFKQRLASGDIIAVQGHTDDEPFVAGAGKDNWMLSGERAAAAARVLTEPSHGVGISPCQIAVMGFGPSRPVERVLNEDDPQERKRKRALNRRIEFRMLRGTDISGAGCAAR